MSAGEARRLENVLHDGMQHMVIRGWEVEDVVYDNTTIPPTPHYTLKQTPISEVTTAELLAMLKRFAARGEQLWDDVNFRDGYKKIPSGDLVDCRNLLRKCGVTEFTDE